MGPIRPPFGPEQLHLSNEKTPTEFRKTSQVQNAMLPNNTLVTNGINDTHLPQEQGSNRA